jgi:SSS family solute:Na+ symporter
MSFGIILGYLSLLLVLGLFASRLFKRTSGDFFLASRGIGPFMLLMSIFGTTMTAFALIGSTGKTFERGIGVYGLMASWSGIVHAAIFFLVGAKVWALGKKHGYVTQLSYFRDRYKSDGLVLTLFPLLVLFVMLYILMGVIGSGRFIENITPETFAMEDSVEKVVAERPADLEIPDAWKDRLSYDETKGAFIIKGSLHPKRYGLFRKFSEDAGWANPKTGTAKKIVNAAPKGAVTAPFGMALICVVVLFYVFFGGMRATAWANTMQTIVFMIMGIIAFWVITKELGGPTAASEALLDSPRAPEVSRMQREGLIGQLQFLTYVFIPLSVGMFPHLFQHWLTARKASNFKLTVVAHPICILVTWLPCVLLGMWATSVLPEATKPNAVLGMMVARFSNEILAGLIGAGVLAAIMSSMDSQFLCLSSIFTNDIVARYITKDKIDDRKRILYGRLFVLGVVLAAYLIGLSDPGSVFDMGVWCFTGFASLSPVLFAALYWKRSNKQGAIASVLVTGGLWLGFLPQVIGRGPDDGEFLFGGAMPVALMVLCSTAALVIVTLMTPPPEKETVDKFFGEKAPV